MTDKKAEKEQILKEIKDCTYVDRISQGEAYTQKANRELKPNS